MLPSVPTPPLRVLFVLEHFWPQVGGVETLFYRHAAALTARGHACTVLTTRPPGSRAEEVVDGIRVVRVGRPHRLARYAFPFTGLAAALALARASDVIHTTTYAAAPLAWLAGRVRGVPVVLTVHEYLGALWHALPDTSWFVAAGLRAIEAVTVRLPYAGVVGVSRATRNALRQAGLRDARLATVYNGVDDADGPAVDAALSSSLAARLKPNGEALVGYYGRAGVTKGVEVLVEAVARLRRSRSVALLLILGDHPVGRRERLAAHARELLGDAVTVLPSLPRAELVSHLDACDVLAVPSLTEGFGFTAWEACATGKPVVASDVGAIPEVAFGRALLVPPADPDALADGLRRAIAGAVPCAPRRDFPVADMVDGYLGVYERVRAPAATAPVVGATS